MSSKKKTYGFEKGMKIFIRRSWGDNAGQIDENELYEIKSIGSIRATVKRINKDTGESLNYHGRGHSYYLYSESSLNPNDRRRNIYNYPTRWDHIFVPVGNAGWDPDFNFTK